MTSEVGICNRALQKLGAATILSLTENSKPARACNNAYELVRDALMRSHPWNFALTRTSLAKLASAPSWGYDNQYQLPSDCLRLLEVRDNNGPGEWTIEGRRILTDAGAPLYIRYIARETDPAQFDALFVEALAAMLAREMCEELTQSNTKRELAQRELEAWMMEARRRDGQEDTPDEFREDDWILARL